MVSCRSKMDREAAAAQRRISAPCRVMATDPVSISGPKDLTDRPPSIAIQAIYAPEAGEEGAPVAPSTSVVAVPAPEGAALRGVVATAHEARAEGGRSSATLCLRRSRPRRLINREAVVRHGPSLRGTVVSRSSAALRH